MRIGERVARWFCAHEPIECHTWLIGGNGGCVETTTQCRACGKGVPTPRGLWSYNAMLTMLDQAKKLPDGAREQVN